MNKFIYIVLLWINVQQPLWAQDSSVIPIEINADSTINVHEYNNTALVETNDTTIHFSQLYITPDSIQYWKNKKDFAYAGYLDSLLALHQQKEQVEQPASTEPGWLDQFLSAKGTSVFFWALAVIFILFILYKLFLSKGFFSKPLKEASSGHTDAGEEKLTVESDFERMILQSVQTGNYRLAIRYQYLKTLHLLSTNNFIELATDKTNYQYVSELKNSHYRNDFASLTMTYEYVWYGEFVINENGYQKIEKSFIGFNKKI